MTFLKNNPPASADIAGVVKLSNSADSSQDKALTPLGATNLSLSLAPLPTGATGRGNILAARLVQGRSTGYNHFVLPSGGTWFAFLFSATLGGGISGGVSWPGATVVSNQVNNGAGYITLSTNSSSGQSAILPGGTGIYTSDAFLLAWRIL